MKKIIAFCLLGIAAIALAQSEIDRTIISKFLGKDIVFQVYPSIGSPGTEVARFDADDHSLRVGNITNLAADGAPAFPYGISASGKTIIADKIQADTITDEAGTGAPTFPFGLPIAEGSIGNTELADTITIPTLSATTLSMSDNITMAATKTVDGIDLSEDIQSGAFAPTFISGCTSGTAKARYIKIGKSVLINGSIEAGGCTGTSITLSTLPFPIDTSYHLANRFFGHATFINASGTPGWVGLVKMTNPALSSRLIIAGDTAFSMNGSPGIDFGFSFGYQTP